MSSVLGDLLKDEDAWLGTSGDGERLFEQFATGVVAEAEATFEWLCDLKGDQVNGDLPKSLNTLRNDLIENARSCIAGKQ